MSEPLREYFERSQPLRSFTLQSLLDYAMSEKLVNFKAQFFKALSNPLRIRILDELREKELTVSEMRERLNVELPNLSQQLSVLRSKNLVVARKQGTNIYYSCSDGTIFQLLDVAKKIFNNHLTDLQKALVENELH